MRRLHCRFILPSTAYPQEESQSPDNSNTRHNTDDNTGYSTTGQRRSPTRTRFSGSGGSSRPRRSSGRGRRLRRNTRRRRRAFIHPESAQIPTRALLPRWITSPPRNITLAVLISIEIQAPRTTFSIPGETLAFGMVYLFAGFRSVAVFDGCVSFTTTPT